MKDILLTDEEMSKVKFDMGSPWGLVDRATVGKAIAKAQLAKAEPIIRKDEREKVFRDIEKYGVVSYLYNASDCLDELETVKIDISQKHWQTLKEK